MQRAVGGIVAINVAVFGLFKIPLLAKFMVQQSYPKSTSANLLCVPCTHENVRQQGKLGATYILLADQEFRPPFATFPHDHD